MNTALSAHTDDQVLVRNMDSILEDVLLHGFRLDHGHQANGGKLTVRLVNDTTECAVSPDFPSVEGLVEWLRVNVDTLS